MHEIGLDQGGSGLVGCLGLDGQGMNALGRQGTQGIIHEAMSREPGEPAEVRARDLHREVPSFAGTGVAGVLVAVVAHLQPGGRETLAQAAFDL
jgi:hypothetical protein